MDARRKDKADTNLQIASELALSAVCCQLIAGGGSVDVLVSRVRSSMIDSDKWQLREAALVVLQCYVEGDDRVLSGGRGEDVLLKAVDLLSDPVAKVRRAAARVMRTVAWRLEDLSRPNAATRRLLAMMVGDVDTRTRLEAFTTLCGSYIEDPLSLLKECLEHELRLRPLGSSEEVVEALELHADTLVEWAAKHHNTDNNSDDAKKPKPTLTSVNKQLKRLLSLMNALLLRGKQCKEQQQLHEDDMNAHAVKWARYAFAAFKIPVGDNKVEAAVAAAAAEPTLADTALQLLVQLMEQHGEAVADVVLASMPTMIERVIGAVPCVETATTFIATLAKHWPTELAPWVGPLSSAVTKGSFFQRSQYMVLCLAWLAQCGTCEQSTAIAHEEEEDEDDEEEIEAEEEASPVQELVISPILDAIHSCGVSTGVLSGLSEKVPTRGLINLLTELFVARHPPIAIATSPSAEAELGLLIVLVRRLAERVHPINKDQEEDNGDNDVGAEEERTAKVRQVLRALIERIDELLLRKHAHEWREAESELRRFLPATAKLLTEATRSVAQKDKRKEQKDKIMDEESG